MGIIKEDKVSGATAVADPSEADASTVVEAPPTGNELNATPTLLEGATVQVTSGEHTGRMAVVTGHEFDDDDELTKWHSAYHPLRAFARVSHYILRTRDAQNITITAKPDEVKPLSTIDGWGRGQV